MSIVADHYRFVVGVDTHAATHSYAVVECPTGRIIDEATFPTSTTGIVRAQTWIGRRTNGEVSKVLIAAEGTGSYGAIAADRFERAGYRVVEAPTPSAKRLRGNGKTDALDAVTAARSAIVTDLDDLRDRRRGELRAALNILTVARDQMATERTRAVNTLTALLRSHDLGIDARQALSGAQISTIAGWRRRDEPVGLMVARGEAVRLARRISELGDQLKSNRAQLDEILADHVPQLLALPGVGAV
uniref:IS110 family transposase n=1 Tax=Nocardia noduli TaxID=2815722 RepID=UPI001C245E5D